jgi:TonB-dependent receptor
MISLSGKGAAFGLALGLVLPLASLTAQTNPQPTPPKSAEDETVVLGEFVVKGVRASLIGAQEIKQQSNQFVDSIVAQDIGKLPDNSVADALQHVAGIQVSRDSGEVGTVLIRGLPNLGTTLNGHEIFTGTGRGVALGDIGAELVAGVDVYKTSTPDQIEGGIAGLIDIRLHRPFDFKGLELAAGVRGVEGKNADKLSYNGNALFSNRWKLSGGGELGILFGSSYDRRHYVDQTIFNFLFEPDFYTVVGQATRQTIELPVTQGSLIIPGDRRRASHNLALQWRPNKELEIYSDFLFNNYRNEHSVNFLIGFPRFGAQPYQSATVYPGTTVGHQTVSTNNFHLTSTQAFRDRTDGYQGVLGAKWSHDSFKVNTEVVYNWSSFKNRGVIVDTQFNPATPATFYFNMNNDGMADLKITGADVTDPKNYYLWGLFDNHGYQTAKETAWKADGQFTLNDGFIRNVKAGIRATSRTSKSRNTSVNDIAPADGRGTRQISTIPGFAKVSAKGDFKEYNTPAWNGGDPEFLLNSVSTIRTLFGRPLSDPNFNPASAFDNKETSLAGYLQAGYKADLGGLPLDGLFGFRVVNTKSDMTGFRDDGTALKTNETQNDILPVVNGRLKLEDNLFARFSIGRTITRPNFGDINPSLSTNRATTTGGAVGTGSGGNPDLKTVRSDNYDVSLEYYFAKESFVSLAGFYRSIDGYVQTFASRETIDGSIYIITRPRNSGKGHLQGLEISYQHFPDFFPPALKGLGWQTNFTYTTGKADTADATSVTATNPVAKRIQRDYTQVAKFAYNLIGIYERGAFSARLAYNWRGKYTDTFDGPNSPAVNPVFSNINTPALRQIIVKPTSNLDLSASYAIGEHLTLTLDITNILNSRYQDYFLDQGLYPRDTRARDQTASVGLRYRY